MVIRNSGGRALIWDTAAAERHQSFGKPQARYLETTTHIFYVHQETTISGRKSQDAKPHMSISDVFTPISPRLTGPNTKHL